MHTAYHDSKLADSDRRRRLYDGQIFVFSPRQSSLALAEHARSMIEEAFGCVDPVQARYEMSVEQYVEICAPLKPVFIQHPRTKELVRAVLDNAGCDLDRHPAYWSRPVKNGSSEFSYYEWNSTGRKEAAKHVTADRLFSPAQMHSTVPNTSGVARYSIDFRTVHLDEVEKKSAAPNVDSAPNGTSVRDFKRASDFSGMPEELVALLDDTDTPAGELVFQPGS